MYKPEIDYLNSPAPTHQHPFSNFATKLYEFQPLTLTGQYHPHSTSIFSLAFLLVLKSGYRVFLLGDCRLGCPVPNTHSNPRARQVPSSQLDQSTRTMPNDA